jgi:hypothetical protein
MSDGTPGERHSLPQQSLECTGGLTRLEPSRSSIQWLPQRANCFDQ